MTDDLYYTGGSSASNVIIESMRNNKSSKRNNNIMNNSMNTFKAVKEQQLCVIRESCPSPLGENELIDDLGIPFEPMSAT